MMMDKIALTLLIIGGLNWGSVGLFQFDLVAFACGGSGSMIGTLVGTLLIGVINNALNLFRVDAEWQNVAKGFIIFLAVLFDAVKNRMKQAE